MQVSPSCAGRTPLEGDVVSQLPSLSETFPHLPMVCISFPPTLLLIDSLVSVTRNVRMVAIQGGIFFFLLIVQVVPCLGIFLKMVDEG